MLSLDTIRLQRKRSFSSIYQQASRLMDTRNMYIALYDAEQERLSFPVAILQGECDDLPSRKVELDESDKGGLIEEVLRSKQARLISNVEKYCQERKLKLPMPPIPKSWLGVPIMVESKVLGLIVLWNNDLEDAYRQHDLEILQAMAGQAAVATLNVRLYENLTRQSEQLEAVSQRLAKIERLAELGQLASSLAHRIGNKGGTVRLRAYELNEYLREKLPNDPTVDDAIEAIIRNNQYLLDLSLLLFKPLRAAEKRMARSNIKLLINGAINSAEIPSDVKIERHYADGLPLVKINRFFIDVCLELITNATYAMENSPQKVLTIRAEYDDAWVFVSFTDTGVGVKASDEAKIFEWFTLPEKKKSGQHLGFGLWWVKTFLRNIGGDIELERADVGTTFIIRLPREEA